MKVLVTGAAGRLGSCVCRLLAKMDVEFLAVDQYPDPQATYPVRQMNLLDSEVCGELLEGVDVLAHFANHTEWKSDTSENVYYENGTMNMNLFQSAEKAGCKRIVFASSIQVMDGQLPVSDRSQHPNFLPYIPMDSNMPAVPRNTYALSKQAAESSLEYFSQNMGITCVVIRFPLLMDSMMLKETLENGGMGKVNCYDGFAYLPIYSGAEAVLKAMTAELDGYHCYFVASKDNLEQRSTLEVIESELAHLSRKKPIEEMDSLVDCSKVESELGWTQPMSLAASFEEYREFESVKSYA